MEEILEKLLRIAGVEGALVVGKDGLVIASVGEFSPDPDSFGASVAELLNHFDILLQARGGAEKVSIHQEKGLLQLNAINEVTFLVVQAGSHTNLGRLRLDSEGVVAVLSEQL